ncbi:VOC family protein [Enterococcus sp. DIV0242_7C1]|uniref:Catechol 2,3-dioxygenase n=1 Tax=Candidatus Enterococcus dunnyi TaxID=1834192 RepID=A0A200IV31_9ENTE|nr:MULTISPECIES: VOC family protein [unclassified Enterococcus]MBO0471217.1 VOC family protein [Enterococcus sp. DIV0242_7C1]OUZ28391.1 hypothetical protein A5889_003146 [Enterococcus sp. 9D6_DIV0238]
MFQLSAETHPSQVVLKVKNLEKMVAFYTEIVGLMLVKSEAQTAYLSAQGTPEKIILVVKQLPEPQETIKTAGLYHIAFLLPTRKDLGNTLLWLLQNNIEIGAGEHGYSEALYFSDPEGNGIEIYRDRPMEDWDIRENGEIVGVTEELDADGIIAEADRTWRGMPLGSKIGHIHLSVSDIEKSGAFMEKIGFSLKYNFGRQAKFFAAGNYHHHIGMNVWESRDLPKMQPEQFGLESYTFSLPNKEAYEQLQKHLQEQAIAHEKNDNALIVPDPNGTALIFTYD